MKPRLSLALLLILPAVAAPTPDHDGIPSLHQSSPVPVLGTAVRAVAAQPQDALPLQYEQDFQQPDALADFVLTDPAAWKLVSGDAPGLELTTQSNYQPPVRSPVNIALIADRVFGDFVLDCDLMQTGPEYGHRDMCLFFGLQNPTNFYYVHLATAADDNAHNVFIVKNAPRAKIARETTPGVNWGVNVWHHVRLERRIVEGIIRVWFDDPIRPIMVAEDRSFGAGYIGFGSFDDTGRIAKIRVHGTTAENRKTTFFRRP